MLSEKVRPKQIAALIGNENSRLEVIKWLKEWKLGSKALLLTGPPGVGKSTSIYAVASEFGYTVIEYNASDVRTKSKLSQSLGGALKNSSLFGESEKLLIFLDEVDGLSGRADYAGIDYILEFIENATIPVAMAANVEDDPKLKKLEQRSQVVRFRTINSDLIFIYLKSIAKREELVIPDSTMRQISESCRGDVRYALNLLQTVFGEKASTSQTDRQFFSDSAALDAILNSNTLEDAVNHLRQFDASPFEKVRSIFDSVVSSKNLSVDDRASALKSVADADILLSQINRNQRWRLLRYLDRYLAHAIAAKHIRRSDSSIPWNIRIAIWNDGRVTKRISEEISGDYHVGKNVFATFYLPYMAFYFKNNSDELASFLSKYEYGDSEKRVILKMTTKS